MGKRSSSKQVVIAKTDDMADFREQLVQRQLYWLMFWGSAFLVAGMAVGLM